MRTTLPADPGHAETADPDALLDALSLACGQLERLAAAAPSGSPRLYHRSVSIIHEICDGLIACEAAGVEPSVIRARTVGARAIHAASPFVSRLQQWPRGYAGDFETIEWLWRADNRAPAGTLAHAIERYALNAAIAQQHRNKVAFQAASLLHTFTSAPACRVLSLGCGSSPDLRSIVQHVPADATIVLCDSDRNALSYSRDQLHAIADRCHFVHGMVPRVLRRVVDHGPFDLILAGGLFDYLSDRMIARVLSDAWSMLRGNGRIVFTNIAAGNPFRVWIEYMGDWKLLERSEGDVASLCQMADVPEPAMIRDATSLAIVATVHKSNAVTAPAHATEEDARTWRRLPGGHSSLAFPVQCGGPSA